MSIKKSFLMFSALALGGCFGDIDWTETLLACDEGVCPDGFTCGTDDQCYPEDSIPDCLKPGSKLPCGDGGTGGTGGGGTAGGGTGGEGTCTPSGEELCDGIDNDCDDEIDEDFPDKGSECTAGESGVCIQSDVWVCAADKKGLVCPATAGVPLDEVCDGLDNDCNDETDEPWPTLGTACFAGIGGCKVEGQLVCSVNQREAECDAVAGDPADAETCDNGIDDDCDQSVDDGCPCEPGQEFACGPEEEVGECKIGKQICTDQRERGSCEGAVLSTTEICNGKDDDCDGVDDNGFGLGEACSLGKGACEAQGVFRCKADETGRECDAIVGEGQDEICGNGKDDDCDGAEDEDWPIGDACSVGVGACETVGVYVCDGGAAAKCNAVAGTAGDKEVCLNNVDEDCDGSLTNGCDCQTPGETRDCGATTNEGECSIGTETCGNDGKWGDCKGDVQSTEEICNNKDDDCDSETDEELDACINNDTLRSCNGADSAFETSSCAALGKSCVNGACFGICVHGHRQCNGKMPQTCIAGAWADDPGGVCSGFCLADGVAHTAKCVACEPTTVECVSLEQMRTCNGSGAWVTKNCVDETCHSNYGNKCGGECEQGGKTCDYNNNLPRTCTSSGKWQDAPAACQTRSIVARPS